MKRNWTYEKHPTKYPDLFTYQILEPNEDYGKIGEISQHIKQFGVCDLDSEENTKLIVKAVNSHEALLEALKDCVMSMESTQRLDRSDILSGALSVARDAIKQAKES